MLFRLRDWRDDATWAEFYGLYHRFVYGQARGAGLSHHEAEEVTHEVFQRVAETITEFEVRAQRGSFRRWLVNLTRWRIADHRRRMARVPGAGGATIPPGHDGDDDAPSPLDSIAMDDSETTEQEEREWQRLLLDMAMVRLSRRVSPQHLQLFQLHHREGWSLVRVSRELGVSLPSAYIINHRLTKQLRVEIERLREQTG